ncbi:17361_t:CDS:2 [Entrophospora sp. SA101]|nr:17361_t:CDS:2 [Entrophospora sp. SA101]
MFPSVASSVTDDNKDQKKTFSFYKTEMCRSLEDKVSRDDNNGNNFFNNTRSSCKSGGFEVDVDLIKKRSLSLCGTDESQAVQKQK